MTKLKNQRKITHRAQKNPRKSDLMTENMHRRKLYDEAELQKKKMTVTWPIIQTSDITLGVHVIIVALFS